MFSLIQKRLARSTATLSEVRRELMRHVKNTISEWRRLSWKDLRRGVSPDFVLTLLSLAILTYFIWGFDHIERLYDSVVLNLLPAALPPLAFFEAMRQEPAGRRFSWWNAGLTFFLALALGIAVSDKFDLDALGFNLVMIMASSPWFVISWILVREKRILAIGIVPAALIVVAYWVAPAFSGELELHYFLIPLTAVSVVIAPWTVLVWIFFKGIDRWPDHPTLSPLMESLAMLFLFMPLMVLAIWVPRTIPGGDDWSVVLAAMVGVVFGSVVSEPLGRFLRSYGDLPSHRRFHRGIESEQGQDSGGCCNE